MLLAEAGLSRDRRACIAGLSAQREPDICAQGGMGGPPAANGMTGTSGRVQSPARRYLAIVAASAAGVVTLLAVAFALLSVDRGPASDHPLQLARRGDAAWYRDFGGRVVPQIQDQDIFFSNIGGSVAAATTSDIVFLGPSFVTYALDRATLMATPSLDRLKIYNMAFVGIRGGEFSRRVIERWRIRPRLWVINADDQFTHFFSSDLNVTLGPAKQPVQAVHRSRLRGYLTVAGRNLRWRVEDIVTALQTGQVDASGLYRHVGNGDMALEANPAYAADDNKPMVSARDAGCHTNPDVVAYARRFLQEIGGRVVLTLVPHSQSCTRQAAELAQALGVELITPGFDGLTTVDGGGHLDRKGAEVFTRQLAAALVRTAAFRAAFAE
jgi:hypothetical protein